MTVSPPHNAPPEFEVVSAWRVACDGGEGALGHPRVWLSVDHKLGFVECGYCDKLYVHEDVSREVLPRFGIEAP